VNKNFELAKISTLMAITLSIIGSAFYLSYMHIVASSFQFMNGREELAATAMKLYFNNLAYAYALWLSAIIFLCIATYYWYMGVFRTKN
jgi:hypothetical protein